ncbi:competence protein CoiA family protein [Tamlana crocina]|uniref:Competence protein CoiA-like N-terminal domain-containing protein n=1 Tax=Tamlana crocina TaxID=393006 RepID=A0ABX1D8F3_9FLAO|nr:hypothetical protein [Tamlana crocina]
MIERLIYGLQNGKLVTIDDVQSGLSCGCVCPNCKSKLIAKKGNIREHHFAHINNNDCFWRGESLIHLKSKEIISNSRTIKLPKLIWSYNPEILIFDEVTITIDKVTLERKVNDFIPDIIIESKGRKLLIEIIYSHGVNNIKYRKIRKTDIPAIGINVKDIVNSLFKEKDYFFNSNKFKTELINSAKYKFWIYNPELIKLRKILKSKYAERHVIQTLKSNNVFFDDMIYSEYCPIAKRTWQSGILKGESYAKLYEDCENCKYYLGRDEYEIIGCNSGVVIDKKPAIYCIGHLGSPFDLDIRNVINKHKKKIRQNKS